MSAYVVEIHTCIFHRHLYFWRVRRLKSTGNFFNRFVLKRVCVSQVPQMKKFAEVHQKWQPIQLVSSLTFLASKEVIKNIHAKNMKFLSLMAVGSKKNTRWLQICKYKLYTDFKSGSAMWMDNQRVFSSQF